MKNITPSSLCPPLPLVLMLLLLQGPGGYMGSASTLLNCPADITVSCAEDLINMKRFSQSKQFNILYVHPEPGFSGVSLVVKRGGGGERLDIAWIALEKECFQGATEWWELFAMAMAMAMPTKQEDCDPQGDCRNITGLLFIVHTSECRKICFKPDNFSSVANYTVRGHGASKWRLHKPKNNNCTFSGAQKPPQSFSPPYPTCPEPPTPAQEGNTVIITGVAVAVVVVMVVVVITVAVMRVRQRRKRAATVAYSPPRGLPGTSRDQQDDNYIEVLAPVYDDVLNVRGNVAPVYDDVLNVRGNVAPVYDDVLNVREDVAPVYDDVLNVRGNVAPVYDDVLNVPCREDVAPIYEEIQQTDIYLTPRPPPSGWPRVVLEG